MYQTNKKCTIFAMVRHSSDISTHKEVSNVISVFVYEILPDCTNNSDQTYSCPRDSLGIMGYQLRILLKPLN